MDERFLAFHNCTCFFLLLLEAQEGMEDSFLHFTRAIRLMHDHAGWDIGLRNENSMRAEVLESAIRRWTIHRYQWYVTPNQFKIIYMQHRCPNIFM